MECLVQHPQPFWTGAIPAHHGLAPFSPRDYLSNFYFSRKRSYCSTFCSGSSIPVFYTRDDDVDYPTDIKSETTPYNCMVDDNQEFKVCVVCGEKASGYYFGALVCLPCKSFYIRCTKDGEPTFTCQCSGNCDIAKQGRIRCQYCRYQRCLMAGMCRKEKPETVQPAEGQVLCKVCGDIANGIHFGVNTCEGCKKFFRRGLVENQSYVCKSEKNCTINPRNRNNCRFCRYKKCLEVGMSREAIKMGRPKKSESAESASYSSIMKSESGLDESSISNDRLSIPSSNCSTSSSTAFSPREHLEGRQISSDMLGKGSPVNKVPHIKIEEDRQICNYENKLDNGNYSSLHSMSSTTTENWTCPPNQMDTSTWNGQQTRCPASACTSSSCYSDHQFMPSTATTNMTSVPTSLQQPMSSEDFIEEDMDEILKLLQNDNHVQNNKTANQHCCCSNWSMTKRVRCESHYISQQDKQCPVLHECQSRWSQSMANIPPQTSQPSSSSANHPTFPQEQSCSTQLKQSSVVSMPSPGSPHCYSPVRQPQQQQTHYGSTQPPQGQPEGSSSCAGYNNIAQEQMTNQDYPPSPCVPSGSPAICASGRVYQAGSPSCQAYPSSPEMGSYHSCSSPLNSPYSPEQYSPGQVAHSPQSVSNVSVNVGYSNSTMSPQPHSPNHCHSPQMSPHHISPNQMSPPHLKPNHRSPPHMSHSHASPPHMSPSQMSPSHMSPPNMNPSQMNPPHMSPGHMSPSHDMSMSSPCQDRGQYDRDSLETQNSCFTPCVNYDAIKQINQYFVHSTNNCNIRPDFDTSSHTGKTRKDFYDDVIMQTLRETSSDLSDYQESKRRSEIYLRSSNCQIAHVGSYSVGLTQKYWSQSLLEGYHNMTKEKSTLLEHLYRNYTQMVSSCTDVASMSKSPNWPDLTREPNYLKMRIVRNVSQSVKFAMSIPGFSSLSSWDKMLLCGSCSYMIHVIASAQSSFNPMTKTFSNQSSWNLTSHINQSIFHQHLLHIAEKIHNLQMDVYETAVLCALIHTSTDFIDLTNPDAVEQVRAPLLAALQAHETSRGLDASSRIQQIFSVVPEVRHLSSWHGEIMKLMKLNSN
ncbi:hypothetical protein CHS0354_020215 [Potamilus streckersoni]|uniref:Uncharacterized protein n=1 Tax=Potamilus streckersoni TaxID=2493646 RepID=A0AAE0SK70_9BIVA|nr:hypothetical protein CHS0354_020215 [Potamilus streckersoni]